MKQATFVMVLMLTTLLRLRSVAARTVSAQDVEGGYANRPVGVPKEKYGYCLGQEYGDGVINNGHPWFLIPRGQRVAASRHMSVSAMNQITCDLLAVADASVLSSWKCFLLIWWENRRDADNTNQSTLGTVSDLWDAIRRIETHRDVELRSDSEVRRVLEVSQRPTSDATPAARAQLSGLVYRETQAWDSCSKRYTHKGCRDSAWKLMSVAGQGVGMRLAARYCLVFMYEGRLNGRWD